MSANKQTMADLKLKRLTEHKDKLKEDLYRPMMKVSESSDLLIQFCKTTKDPLVPSVWGPVPKSEDRFAPQPAPGGGCCVVA
ncbi:G-protein gamma subunit [Mrakia frigida]|uniref:guanine nucleotide-binding protein subunit gamma n=1 Tax=Mrakia frigida TaxID=29902 RepID=UPI003FCC1D4E